MATVRCPSAPELVGPVRNFVHECAVRLGAGEGDAETARLLTSELVSNIVRHTPWGTPVRVNVLHDPECHVMVVAVEDSHPCTLAIPLLGRPAPEDESGWGLPLVSRLAHEYGIAPLAQGKRVWFTIALNT
ncbi:ATP-binding protein [Yinghuangia sp. ASG 101]|uniref:ATP-binding protein n=1 Tax=Yinghuangia sp. ASG 101 TaxID=2896848 RepID=UPI001E320414|nr:ATP-binding protein [Yinghuangia sp. ASG 101]UGQ14715.1 ATP-binding protein [Yinghuangia sp. ASG 101]